MIEHSGGSSPHKSHNALGDHSTIEHGAGKLFVANAASHKRRLRGMEAADCSTSDGYEEHREDGSRIIFCTKAIPHLGQVGALHIEHYHNAYSHKEQRSGKNRINLADNLVDGEHGGKHIVEEDYHNPRHHTHIAIGEAAENVGRTAHPHRSHENEQHNGEHAHHALHTCAKEAANNLRQTLALVAHGDATHEEIVHCTAEDGAKDNPQVGSGAKLCAHYRAENRTQSGNVEELNHKQLPGRKHDVIYAIGHRDSRSGTVVGTENAANEPPVDKIARNEG